MHVYERERERERERAIMNRICYRVPIHNQLKLHSNAGEYKVHTSFNKVG